MDWKRLVQFAVQVVTRFGWAVPRHLRANKLFVAGGLKPVYDTLVKAKAPSSRRSR